MNDPHIPAAAGWEVLAEQPLDRVDAQLLDRVAAMYETFDPVPAGLIDRLQFAISLNAMEFELAELQQADLLTAARSDAASAVKNLTFTSDSLSTMINIADAGADRVRIDGWLAPGAAATVELHQGQDRWEARADEDGRFVFAEVPHGLTRFAIRVDGAGERAPVVTPAVEI